MRVPTILELGGLGVPVSFCVRLSTTLRVEGSVSMSQGMFMADTV